MAFHRANQNARAHRAEKFLNLFTQDYLTSHR